MTGAEAPTYLRLASMDGIQKVPGTLHSPEGQEAVFEESMQICIAGEFSRALHGLDGGVQQLLSNQLVEVIAQTANSIDLPKACRSSVAGTVGIGVFLYCERSRDTGSTRELG